MTENRDSVIWTKSSFSNGGSACVEVGRGAADGSVLVRHTRDRDGATLRYTREEWGAFLQGAKSGEFELED